MVHNIFLESAPLVAVWSHVTTTMCASRVLALVDRRLTPQAQGAKVRAQGAKIRTEGAKIRTEGAKFRTSISASQ